MPRFLEQIVAKPGPDQNEDFSLVLGGPLYQLLLRSKLIPPSPGHVMWRAGVISGFAWLPLVPLTIIGRRFIGGVPVPFLYDFEVQVRLLFSLPLLILAETVVDSWIRTIATQFSERQIITESERPAFSAVLSSTMRLRNSLIAELAILALVIVAGPYVWRSSLALRSSTWYAVVAGATSQPSLAGRWYEFFSVPIFQFILLRWYYRIFIWSRFLFQVSRLNLNLNPLHPDRCCGLGFLGDLVFAFAPLIAAHSALVAGFVANRVLYEGASLAQYKFELLGIAVYLLAIFLGPLCVFLPKLHVARLAGLRTYGRLASDYVVGFARKWVGGTVQQEEPLLGSSDIQSLADLDSSFGIVKETKLIPFGKQTILWFVIMIVLPLAPLALTTFSVEELLRRLLQIVL